MANKNKPARRIPYSAVVIASSLIALAHPASGRAAPGKLRYDIEPGTSPDTLAEFVRQSSEAHISIIFNFAWRVKTNGVHATALPSEALAAMLSGTRLRCEVLGGGKSLSISLGTRVSHGSRCATTSDRTASEQQGPTQGATETLQEVKVVSSIGTRIPGGSEIGWKLSSWDRDQIQQSGFSTASDLVRSLTQTFAGGPSEDTHSNGEETRSNSGLGVGVNLRGLGARATLVLLNGHRITPSGSDASFVDLLGIPIVAIERIDVLLGGASALYGSDAVGGVVNIVTTDNYAGAETFASVGSVTAGSQEQDRVSQIFGTHWNTGNIVVGFERWHRGALPSQDRAEATSDLVPFGGPNLNSPYSNPGNLPTAAGTIAIPRQQNGSALNLANLAPGAPNLTDQYADADIVPDQRRDSFFGVVRQALDEDWMVTGHLLWSERHAAQRVGGQMTNLSIAHSPLLHDPPSGVDTEEYDLEDDLGPVTTAVTVRTSDYSVDVVGEVLPGWQLSWSADASRESENQLTRGEANPAKLQSAIDAGTFDPFGDGSYTSATTLAGIRATPWFGMLSELGDSSANIDGPVATLPGGDLSTAFGMEYRWQRFDSALSTPATRTRLRRELLAAYSEWGAPLVGPGNALPGLQALEISAALRYEHYSDFGQTTAPRVGLLWSPARGVELRGSWGRSTRAPNLGDLNERGNVSFLSAQQSSPTATPIQTLAWSGNNANLTAERATTRMFGVSIATTSWPRLKADFDYFDILFKNRIQGTDGSSGLLFDPQYQDLVIRNPSTALRQQVCHDSVFIQLLPGDCLTTPIAAILDLRLQNMATVWTDGLDFAGSLDFATAAGQFGFALSATYILDFKQSGTSLAALQSVLNTQTNPINLQAVAAANWQWRALRATTSLRYQNSYRNVTVEPVRNVGSWTTVDLNLSYARGDSGAVGLGNTTFALTVRNLLQRYPPFVVDTVAAAGYDQENGDLTGRVVIVSVRRKW